MIIWRKRIACWIPNAKNAHTDCVILVAFPLKQWLHERPSMLRYTNRPIYYVKACFVLYNLLYRFSYFLVCMEHQSFENENCRVAIDEPPQGSSNGPVNRSWNRALCYRLSLLLPM
jgi:hypothetical protein